MMLIRNIAARSVFPYPERQRWHPFTPRPYGIAVRKDDQQFIAWVDAQLAAYHKDGTYDRLWKKYFGDVEANLIKP
ncbi:MAG TPA: transporter substrate-binding domain-containing protein [Candidatus Sulfotelmatobacter sp.]|nr:transporter substrate-binding domain-containing protein [Candidatus Sulfotelmatobacter sp.]